MLPMSIHPLLYAFAESAYKLVANRATPCQLREKILRLVEEMKADLPDEALYIVQAEEVRSILMAATYFR